MIEITFEYWNKLANHTIVISSLLAGFSIAVVANIIVSDLNTRVSNAILTISTLASCFFLISVFGWTSVLLMTTDGYPIEVTANDFKFPRMLGSTTFFLGIISLIAMIAISGWTKSKKMGIFTSSLGVLTLIFVIAIIV